MGEREAGRSLWTPGRIAVAALIVAAAAWLVFRGSALVASFFHRIADILVTVVLAVLMAYVAWPIVEGLEALMGWAPPRVRRVVASLVAVVSLVIIVLAVAVYTAASLVEEMGRFAGMIRDWLPRLPDALNQLGDKYGAYLPPEVLQVIRDKALELGTEFIAWQGQLFKGIVVRGAAFLEAFLVPVLAFYFLSDAERLTEGVLAMVPEHRRQRLRRLGRELNRLLHDYVRCQVLLCVCTGLLTAGLLYVAGVRVYISLGLIAGAGWAVPIVGPVVAGVAIGAMTLAQAGWRAMLIVLLVYSGIIAAETKIVMPKLLSGSARLHPVVIIVAILIGAEFFSIVGVLLAVPVAAAARVVLVHAGVLPEQVGEAK